MYGGEDLVPGFGPPQEDKDDRGGAERTMLVPPPDAGAVAGTPGRFDEDVSGRPDGGAGSSAPTGGEATTAFNPSAEEIRRIVLEAFPAARITWLEDTKRQGIVDSWPADVVDTAARRDWGFAPEYDLERAFSEYLIPTIRRHYL